MPLKRQSEPPLELNLTPMIDVVFLLVIFFMTATQFAEVERAVEMELPKVGDQGTTVAAVADPRIVAVSAEGVLTLDGEPRTLDELRTELSAATDSKVLIDGDARCDFQHVAAALTACRAAGVTDVGVNVDTAPPPVRR